MEFDGYISEDKVFTAVTGFDLSYKGSGANSYAIHKTKAETSIDDTREWSATVKVNADWSIAKNHNGGADDVFSGHVNTIVVAETDQ